MTFHGTHFRVSIKQKQQKEKYEMSKHNRNNNFEGQNRCRRCDRPLSDPNDIYGWRCAEIVGLHGDNQQSIIDIKNLMLYNDYVNLIFLHTNIEPHGSFTTKGKNYESSFVIEEKPETKKTIYHVITDITTLGRSFQVEYKIDNGIVRFPFENNDDYGSILLCGGGKTLSKAIYDSSRKLSPNNLSGRTVDGINTELQLHWVAYKAGIKKENAKIADIGSLYKEKDDYDNNAWLFEGIKLAEDIVNPKATDVIEATKELWRYYK